MAEPEFTTEELEQEIWKPLVGWEDSYSVSNLGRVRSEREGYGTWRGRILRQSQTKKGYFRVELNRNRETHKLGVHRLVLEAFIGPCQTGYQCNHKSGNTSDNRLENLEWVTPAENVSHRIRNNLQPRGEDYYNAKLTEDSVRKIRNSSTGATILARRYNVDRTLIWMVRTRKIWKHVI